MICSGCGLNSNINSDLLGSESKFAHFDSYLTLRRGTITITQPPNNTMFAACRRFRPLTFLKHPKLNRTLTLSSVEGPCHPPLNNSTLFSYFNSQILSQHASRPALICRSEAPGSHGGPPSRNLGITSHLAWDFEEFDRHINALARGLLNLGVRKGDRVGVIMGNNRWSIHT